ncbi:MAG: sigma-70 family RNA polymerase sigma factor [Oscillospiraceae bacterium]|nr:sigma-70 family RNA polymerase sigma factor [Oscillospiraceae bacterium]
MTDSEIRSLIKKSPLEGHQALFAQYSNYVYTIVWSKLGSVGSREDADECMSDIFAEVFLHLDSVYEGNLKSYIGTLAKRMAITAFRRLSSESGRTISIEEGFEEMVSEVNIAEDYEKTVAARQLLEKILSLGEPDATIIIQKYYYNRNSAEIGKIVHLNPVAVRMRSSRAIKRLRGMLEQKDFEFDFTIKEEFL